MPTEELLNYLRSVHWESGRFVAVCLNGHALQSPEDIKVEVYKGKAYRMCRQCKAEGLDPVIDG